MGGLEGLHDGDDRGGLGLVALPAAYLEGEAGPVDQQADDDLGIDPTLLGVTDLAQIVLTLGLEVQGGHVVQAQGQAPGSGDMIEQGPRETLTVASRLGPGQAGLQGVAVGRSRPADLGQDSGGVGLGGRLDQAGGDHLLEGPVTPGGLAQSQAGVGRLDDLDQPARPSGGDLRCSHRTAVPGRLAAAVECRPQVQDLLARQEPLAPQVHQRGRLSLVTSRSQVLHDPAHTVLLGHDLHGRSPRGGLDPAQVRAHPPDPTAGLVPHDDHTTGTIPTKNPTQKTKPPQTVQLRSGIARAGLNSARPRRARGRRPAGWRHRSPRRGIRSAPPPARRTSPR